MSDAFKKAGINPSDFEESKVDERNLEANLNIEFLEGWLKMLDRGASAKEKYQYVTKHGYLSEQHFLLCTECQNKVDEVRDELDDLRQIYPEGSVKLKVKDLQLKEAINMAENIRDIIYYKMVMRSLNRNDYSPYGEDLLRFHRS
jgi:hypothetical protein